MGPTGRTGFEEEFERVLARSKADGTPEIWLFLKEIDAVRAADPGEQLRRVLEFKKEQEEAKQLLFKEFKDVGSWRDLLHSLLLRETGTGCNCLTNHRLVLPDLLTSQSRISTNKTSSSARIPPLANATPPTVK